MSHHHHHLISHETLAWETIWEAEGLMQARLWRAEVDVEQRKTETHDAGPYMQNKYPESRWPLWRDSAFQSRKITLNLRFHLGKGAPQPLDDCRPGSVFGNKSSLHNSWQQQRFIEEPVPATVHFKLISSESSEPVETEECRESAGGPVTLLHFDFVPPFLCRNLTS